MQMSPSDVMLEEAVPYSLMLLTTSRAWLGVLVPMPRLPSEVKAIFFLDLKENQRGRFLKITEDVGGRRDSLMLPAEAFAEFAEALRRLVEFESKL